MPSIFLEGTRFLLLLSVSVNVVIRGISHLSHPILLFSDKANDVQKGSVALLEAGSRCPHPPVPHSVHSPPCLKNGETFRRSQFPFSSY